MSGGMFDYKQYDMERIADDLENIIKENNVPIPKGELAPWQEEGDVHSNYSDKTIERFKEGLEVLKKAIIFVHRIDWFLSDDDGEETFHQRLEKDLTEDKTN